MAPSQTARSRVTSPAARKTTLATDQVHEEKPDAKKAPLKPAAVQIPAAPAPQPKAVPAKEASGMSKKKAALVVVVAAIVLVISVFFVSFKANLPLDLYMVKCQVYIGKAVRAVRAFEVQETMKQYASQAGSKIGGLQEIAKQYASQASVLFKTAYAHAVTKAKAEPLLAGTAASVAVLPMVFLLAKKAAGKCRKPKAA